MATAILVATAASACSSQNADPTDAPATTVSSAPPSPQPSSPVEPAAEAGSTRVVVDGVSLPAGGHVAFAFHPDSSPARVWSTSTGFEVCPAGADGTVDENSRWPPWSPFESCQGLPRDGFVLPAADGGTHLGFGVRATEDVDHARVLIDYGRRDGFFEVLTPRGLATDLDVTFQPGSSTIAAIAYDLPNYSPSSSAHIEIVQGTAGIGSAAECDFASETDCLGPVTPDVPVTVHLRNAGSGDAQVALFLSWA